MAEIRRIHETTSTSGDSRLFKPGELIRGLLPGGDDLTAQSPFADDVWELAGHRTWRDKAGAMTRIDFRSLPERFRDAAKEMALLQLNPTLAAERAPHEPMAQAWTDIQEPVAPTTAQSNIKMLSHALRAIERHNITTFDQDDWERLVTLLVQPLDVAEKRQAATLSATTGRGRAQQLIALWQVAEIGGRSGLLGVGRPFGGRETVELFGPRSRHNVVRPHEAVGNALGFVAWVFDEIAEDIVSHVEWWCAAASEEPPLSRDDAYDAMLDLCAQLARDSGGVLPGTASPSGGEPTIAASALGRLLGIYESDEAFLAGRWAKRQLGDSVVYDTSFSPCRVPITRVNCADGTQAPWIDRLMATNFSLDAWQRRLVYYGMYYLAATVMLRDSQLAVLPLDCLVTEEISRPDGSTYVKHTLKAFRTKNRSAPIPTTVTVNGRVARIITLLQRLQAALGYEPARHPQTGLPFLFDQRLATPRGKKAHGSARDGLYLDLSFTNHLRDGARELFERGVLARNLDDMTFNMRQVRITCAQAYAVREHGQALAAAFGQWDTARVAAGYVGDVYRLITPIEPEEAADIAREDAGRRLVRASRTRDTFQGSGLARLDDVLEANGRALSNPQPLNASRLRTIGKNNPNLEQGPLTLCIFQPEGAMCGGRGKPDFRLCWPGQCRNSVMSRMDRARYELMRRQNLALQSPVLRRAADKMHAANPDIEVEFRDMTDSELQAEISEHMNDYIRAALEGSE